MSASINPVARVLLADSDLASRLTLESILSSAGYAVDGAATAAEAILKLDRNEYQLVFADLRSESDEAGQQLLAYARQKEFHPATALIASDMTGMARRTSGDSGRRTVRISDENISTLLGRAAELIWQRVNRRNRLAVQLGR
jgi:CheY-like chemotaxis protein